MKAITVRPGVPDSGALLDVPEPPAEDGAVLVEALAMGVCGTDGEILRADYGEAPPGDPHLVLGHESLGRVLEAPDGCGVAPGDLVVGIVRRPDPVPCGPCGAGEWDMCRNGRYTERGIKGLHGYGAERWRVEPEFCVRLDPSLAGVGVLLEPASVLAKAWQHIDAIAARATVGAGRVLVTGAGPVGLMAALLATRRDFEVHVLDRVEGGPKPDLVRALGATYWANEPVRELPVPDIVVEATGVGELVLDAIEVTRPNGIVCLTGLSPAGRRMTVDAGSLNRTMVLENDVVFGSVNANRGHYEAAARALAAADRDWLEAMITRRVPLERWAEAIDRRPDDVKAVVQFGDAGGA